MTELHTVFSLRNAGNRLSMLWRASHAYVLISSFEYIEYSGISILPTSSIFDRETVIIAPCWQDTRWRSAAIALQVRAVACQPSTSRHDQDHKRKFQRAFKLPSQRSQRRTVAILPQLEQRLLVMVDKLYALQREEGCTRETQRFMHNPRNS